MAPLAVDSPDIQPTKPSPNGKRVSAQQALQAGITAAVFDNAFANVTPDMAVIRADRSQPDFSARCGNTSTVPCRRCVCVMARHC